MLQDPESKWKLSALDEVEEGYQHTRDLFPRLSTRYVPGEGTYDKPEAFIIGEAPGAQEDIAKRPFIGPAGQVLRQLMELAALRTVDLYEDGRDSAPTAGANCWLTNVVKFRPAGNATPTPVEIGAFRRFLQEEWHAVGEPNLIVPVGGVALRAVTGKPISILRAAGKCHKYMSAYTGKPLYIWPMVHPSFVMRQKGNDQLQELIEKDWERLGEWRNTHAPNS